MIIELVAKILTMVQRKDCYICLQTTDTYLQLIRRELDGQTRLIFDAVHCRIYLHDSNSSIINSFPDDIQEKILNSLTILKELINYSLNENCGCKTLINSCICWNDESKCWELPSGDIIIEIRYCPGCGHKLKNITEQNIKKLPQNRFETIGQF